MLLAYLVYILQTKHNRECVVCSTISIDREIISDKQFYILINKSTVSASTLHIVVDESGFIKKIPLS